MSEARRPIVLALGGNAISQPDEEGNIPQQFARTRRTAEVLAGLIADGAPLVITHGNGPQVGKVIRRVELAAHEVYPLPIDICVADTEGGMGYMISTCLRNELRQQSIDRSVCALVTTVEVDRDDPAFDHPSKPIGSFYREEEAQERIEKYGWRMSQRSDGRWRRVVPSPMPQRILEVDLIREMVNAGHVVIAGGGGGVPVVIDDEGRWVGREAVIDKDYTSALLADQLGAEMLIIATDIDRVRINYRSADEQPIDRLTAAEARQYLDDGQFPTGSMGPKIKAAVRFLEAGKSAAKGNNRRVVVCEIDRVSEAVGGDVGTTLTP